MSWKGHFRKSFTKGPIRTTVSNNGASTSIGIPGFRFSVNTTGEKRLTIGIPGSGFYWTKKLDGSERDSEKQDS